MNLRNPVENIVRMSGEKIAAHYTQKSKAQFRVVSVQDNGLGMLPEHQKKIFRPMARLHASEIPGVGIGLATYQKVVEHHGGRIWVESRLDAGSTFYFTLQK